MINCRAFSLNENAFSNALHFTHFSIRMFCMPHTFYQRQLTHRVLTVVQEKLFFCYCLCLGFGSGNTTVAVHIEKVRELDIG